MKTPVTQNGQNGEHAHVENVIFYADMNPYNDIHQDLENDDLLDISLPIEESYYDDDNRSKHKHTIELKNCQCYKEIKECQLKLENIKTYLPKVKPCSTILGCDITTAVEGLWQLVMKMETKTTDIAGMLLNEYHNRDSSGQTVKSSLLIEGSDHYEFISSMVTHHLPLLEFPTELSDYISSSYAHELLSNVEEKSGLLTSMLVHQMIKCYTVNIKDSKSEKQIDDQQSNQITEYVKREEMCNENLKIKSDIGSETEEIVGSLETGEAHIDNDLYLPILKHTADDDTYKDDNLKDNNDSDRTDSELEQSTHIYSVLNHDITETEYHIDENKADMPKNRNICNTKMTYCHQTEDEIFEPFEKKCNTDNRILEEVEEYRSRLQRIKELQKLVNDEFEEYRIHRKYCSGTQDTSTMSKVKGVEFQRCSTFKQLLHENDELIFKEEENLEDKSISSKPISEYSKAEKEKVRKCPKMKEKPAICTTIIENDSCKLTEEYTDLGCQENEDNDGAYTNKILDVKMQVNKTHIKLNTNEEDQGLLENFNKQSNQITKYVKRNKMWNKKLKIKSNIESETEEKVESLDTVQAYQSRFQDKSRFLYLERRGPFGRQVRFF